MICFLNRFLRRIFNSLKGINGVKKIMIILFTNVKNCGKSSWCSKLNDISFEYPRIKQKLVLFCKYLRNKSSQPYGIVTTPTQPQLNSKVGCDMKMTLIHHHHHPPPTTTTTHTNSMSAISQLLLTRFQPNFKVRFLG